MISVTDLTDAELVTLWHRLNCNDNGFWEAYGRSDVSPHCRHLVYQVTNLLWRACEDECNARGIDVDAATIQPPRKEIEV